MRRAAADLGDGFLMRAAALSQNGPRTSLPCPHPVHVGPEVHEVGKITLDRLLIGTQPSVQASELVRGHQVGGLLAGGELGDVAAGLVTWASWRQARVSTPRNCGWYWPVLGAEGDESWSGALPKRARWKCAFAKWLRFWKRRHGPA
jgi:hypothetical protein